MASLVHIHTLVLPTNSAKQSLSGKSSVFGSKVNVTSYSSWNTTSNKKRRSVSHVVAAAGDLSSDSTTYLIAGAAIVALLGTAFPIIFSRKDTCPECDGAGFVRKGSSKLSANAARKDLPQIVCANCNGLGKLNQVDK